jgi:homoserine O-acetyltransferase
LFPLSEQKYLAAHIPNAKFTEIGSVYGHDGFLLEFEAIAKEIIQFLKNNNTHSKPALPAHSQ